MPGACSPSDRSAVTVRAGPSPARRGAVHGFNIPPREIELWLGPTILAGTKGTSHDLQLKRNATMAYDSSLEPPRYP